MPVAHNFGMPAMRLTHNDTGITLSVRLLTSDVTSAADDR